MNRISSVLGFVFICLLLSCSKKIIPDRPFLSKTAFRLDSLPESEINIPIQVNLKPVYQMAERNLDTVFTSPNWPDDWVNYDCATRYKYHFRRGPLQMNAAGSVLNIGFTGYYRIIGSTRVCLGGTVISPWTPPCRCGFDEGERKVKVSFLNSLSVLPDYKVRLSINRQEPQPLDKCQVCFFGVNITNQVINGLKEELDLAKKSFEDSFSVVDLKPRVQQLWDILNTSYGIYGFGWLQINPQKLRLNNLYARNDSLYISFGLTARPIVRFEKPTDLRLVVPDMNDASTRSGFNIFLDAMLNYDSLSNILNSQVKDRRIDFEGGKKWAVINDTRIYGEGNENLVIKISFSGSNSGIAYFTGKPFYDEKTKMVGIRDLDFDVKTRNLLLKTAKWLFNRRIINEITSYARFDVSAYADTAMKMMNMQLNRELLPGTRSYGAVEDIKIIGFYPLSEHLVIRSNASGRLLVKVENIDFRF